MDITVHRSDYSFLLTQNKIRWKLMMQSSFLINYYYLVVGLIFMGLQTISIPEGEPYWGLMPSIGLGFIFLFLVYSVHFYRNKKRFFSKTQSYIQRFRGQTNNITIRVTDTMITYRDAESYSETNWSAYTHYKYHQNHLLLISHDEYFGGVTFGKDEMSAEEFLELAKFVKARFLPKA